MNNPLAHRTHAIISRCLYIFTPFSKTISLFLRRFFSENSVLMYGLYSRAAYDGARTVSSLISNIEIYRPCRNNISHWKWAQIFILFVDAGDSFLFPRFLKNNWYFVTKIVLTYCEKNCSSDREKNFWNLRLKAEYLQFEITRTIYSNSERSEQFLVTECFFNLFLELSHI